MARVRVRLYASFREAAGVPEISAEARDLGELVEAVSRASPRLGKLLEKAKNERDRIVILLNGQNIGNSDFSSVRLGDNDEVAIFPPVSGG